MESPKEQTGPKPAAVYRLFAADATLLYIGSAYSPEDRYRAHSKQPWWPQVARRSEEWLESRGAAYTAEMQAIVKEKPLHNAMGPGYPQPLTNAVLQRNELASLRQKLVGEAGSVSLRVADALRKQGVDHEEAHVAGEVAAINFLEQTGLFAGAVKRRRERLADPRYRDAVRAAGDVFGGRTDRLLRLVWSWVAEAESGAGSVESLRAALVEGGFEQPPGVPVSS
ncbi:hypothetical protein ACFUEN_29070 [Streptomyces griseorubiginosus]|uniref:hypothetical protein n=1 Tax=Streptomyces griseorubiginosus TaxID=67304 RepID=UPI003640C1E5